MLAPTSSNDSLASSLANLPAETRARFLDELHPDEAESLRWDWRFWARPKQLAPPGDWTTWLILAGRGFGKTRSIVEFVNDRVESGLGKRINIIAAVAADIRDVLVEGESGFLEKSPPWLRPIWEPSKRRLTWPKFGARAICYSADKPDRLRGPQCDTFAADELAAWRYPQAFDQAMFGLRLGKDPRAAIATTPRPTPLIKDLVSRNGQDVAVTRGSTYENRSNLADAFFSRIIKKYEGTRIGRQELDAEILDDAPGALWKRDLIEQTRVNKHPDLVRVVVGVDPNVSSGAEGADCGIVTAGICADGEFWILSDDSLEHPTPNEWGKQAAASYYSHHADRIIGEVNNGGDLVESNVRTVDKDVSFKQVRASRGKAVRAEPVAALMEQGRVHHVGMFAKLEDQLCEWEPNTGAKSPDRLDAYVWAVTELLDPTDDGGAVVFHRRN